MKILKTALIATVASLIACSCNRTKTITYEGLEADATETLKAQPLNDTFEFGFASKILQHDSLLIVFDEMQPEMIQFFSKESGRLLGSFGRRGQGDKELVAPSNLAINHQDGTLSIYDYARGKLIACNLNDSPYTNPDAWFTIDLPDYETSPSAVIPVGGDEFVAQHGKPRFTKASGKEIVATIDDFPTISEESDESTSRMFFVSQSLLAVSPDGKKMAQSTTLGSILQLIDVKESAIEPYATRYFHKPIFSVVNGQIGTLDETIYGFACLDAKDEHIYATLHGVANPTAFPNTIHVFDWDGNLIKKLSTDQQICCFTVDENNGKAYAIAISGEGEQMLIALYPS